MRRSFHLLAVAAGLALGGVAAPSSAVSVLPDNLLTIDVAGVGSATMGGAMLGCAPGEKAGTFDCQGGAASVLGGALNIDSWNMFLDTDPVVNAIIAVTNNTLVTQIYTLSVLLPVAPVLPSSLIGGSITGGITSDASAGTLSSNGLSGNAIYTALIDGGSVGTLLPHVSSVSSGAFLSANFTPADFGTPIPSAAGPAALASIGISLEFSLTPGDSASFTSIFVVEPVPEPGTFSLVSLGLLGVVFTRRRQIARR